MTSIPADPSLVLGNYVHLDRIKHLQKIAEAQRPETEANDDLQELILTNYRLKMLLNEISTFDVGEEVMKSLRGEIDQLKDSMMAAAVNLAKETILCAENVETLEQQFGQTGISVRPESPLDFSSVEIKKFPLSSDSMTFDVQYFSFDTNTQDAEAHSNTVTQYASNTSKGAKGTLGTDTDKKTGKAINNMMTAQYSNHEIHGTIVITATCTHRMADMIAPVVLDPLKLLSAWNSEFPNDYLASSPSMMYGVSMGTIKGKDPANKLYLLTGCTRGSSFTGLVHVTQLEETKTETVNSAETDQLSKVLEKSLLEQSQLGNFGVGKDFAKNASDLLSTSTIKTHCNLVTRGVIPDISANTMKSTVMSMKPDPAAIMANLGAMQEATKGPLEMDPEAEADTAKTDTQMKGMNSGYIKDMAGELTALDDESNLVIDTNSMMTAFTNYVSKCEAGGVGVAINYYVMEIDKRKVAKEYFRKFYPNGSARTMEDRRSGMLGQTQEGGEE